jgi:hypothetical protein
MIDRGILLVEVMKMEGLEMPDKNGYVGEYGG